jgi:hypothetical protein
MGMPDLTATITQLTPVGAPPWYALCPECIDAGRDEMIGNLTGLSVTMPWRMGSNPPCGEPVNDGVCTPLNYVGGWRGVDGCPNPGGCSDGDCYGSAIAVRRQCCGNPPQSQNCNQSGTYCIYWGTASVVPTPTVVIANSLCYLNCIYDFSFTASPCRSPSTPIPPQCFNDLGYEFNQGSLQRVVNGIGPILTAAQYALAIWDNARGTYTFTGSGGVMETEVVVS